MAAPEPTAPLVAIGDVHGCASLLREALWPHLGSGVELSACSQPSSGRPAGLPRQKMSGCRGVSEAPPLCT